MDRDVAADACRSAGKRNDANLEANRDGSENNRSSSYGVEGATDAAAGEAPGQGRTAFVNFIRLMSETLTGWPLRDACTTLLLPM